SNLSEGHYFALQIARQVKTISPETIIILGGSHEDGTNPEVYRRAVERSRSGASTLTKGVPRPQREMYEFSERQLSRLDQLRTLPTEEDRLLVDFVAAGDCPFLFMEFMKIVADHLDASLDELKEIILAKREHFSHIQGSGYLFFYRRDNQSIDHVRLSGS